MRHFIGDPQLRAATTLTGPPRVNTRRTIGTPDSGMREGRRTSVFSGAPDRGGTLHGSSWAPASDSPLRVGVLVEERYLDQAEPAGATAALRAAGHDVDLVVAERHVADLAVPLDVGVLLARGRNSAFMTLVRAAEAGGVPVVNSPSSIAAVANKAGMGAALAAAGVPVPGTWVGPVDALVQRSDLSFPLVLKPVYGDNARGLVVVRSRAELAAVPWSEPVALAQTFHRGHGEDLKLYVAGEKVWAVRRPSPVAEDGRQRSITEAGQTVPVTPELAWIARRAGEVFDLGLYGVDLVDSGRGPLVIEVNDYPNYRGAPGASEVIARVVTRLASRTGVRS
jgi:glutathione synthase/RimK-type ligase-like ATP-grasp enzyme